MPEYSNEIFIHLMGFILIAIKNKHHIIISIFIPCCIFVGKKYGLKIAKKSAYIIKQDFFLVSFIYTFPPLFNNYWCSIFDLM